MRLASSLAIVKVAIARSTSPRESLIVLAFSSVMARAILSLRRASPAAARWRISLRRIDESLRVSSNPRTAAWTARSISAGPALATSATDLARVGAADGDRLRAVDPSRSR
jgi:hypothetical protein